MGSPNRKGLSLWRPLSGFACLVLLLFLLSPAEYSHAAEARRSFYLEHYPAVCSAPAAAPGPKEITITLLWNQRLSGYAVQYRLHGTASWTTKIAAASQGALPLKNLKAARNYDVRIRAFRTVGRVRFYGPWSRTTQVTTRKDYTDILILVNQTEGLPEDYVPPDLVDIDGQQLRKAAADAFLEMREAAARDGVRMSVRSGYRSPEEQRETYAYYVKLEGREKADRRVAIPGHSEHQTGLAIDISDGYAWAAKHCVEYGFFISSTEANSAITGFRPEPWHIRYVGKHHAKAYTESGLLTYDEYYARYVN